jgi:hypothetical protein
VNQGARGYCLREKTEGRKSRDTVPLNKNKNLIFRALFCQYLPPLANNFEYFERHYLAVLKTLISQSFLIRGPGGTFFE